jgi:mannose/cellobiose epimerase-like protein (N-acyl-D-glucosamine 2-epimerase family)
MNQSSAYRGNLLPQDPQISNLCDAADDYTAILRSVMGMIVARYERGQTDPWIDTKICLIDGEDFAAEDLLRGPRTVYGWIQGRALSALAGHAAWFRGHPRDANTERIRLEIERIMSNLLAALRAVRTRNSGHVYFSMTRDGAPIQFDREGQVHPVALTEQSSHNFSDLFCATGMYAAACYLQDDNVRADAKDYCRLVEEAVWRGEFASDQQQFDPKNPMDPNVSRCSHGPFMIQLATAALVAEFERDAESAERGLKLIRHILSRHVNLDRKYPRLEEFDFVEFVDDEGHPFGTGEQILSDPGHALEFVGLGLKFLEVASRHDLLSAAQRRETNQIDTSLLQVLLKNFANGFQPQSGGICKLFDLVTRAPINTDMPWWSLPETMRASLACYRVAPSAETRLACLRIFSACHNAFAAHYVKPELNLMAVQTRAADGRVVDVIPATPDADPGYHTGLCLIDCLRMLEEEVG